MHAIMPDQAQPAEPPRGLHEICEDVRRGQCGLCRAMPSEACEITGPDGYHVARFAWAEANGLITAADFDAVLETTISDAFTNATVVYDKGRCTMGADGDLPAALGPFETSSDALLAVRPDDGSFTGPEALFDLLKSALHDTGVRLGSWDWRVVRWLAGQDVQTAAAVAGWVTRSLGELADFGDDGLEPYCTECGSWIGMFFGMEGWHHFRGDPAPGGRRQLFAAEHAAVPAWCQLPGRALSPADAVIVRQALIDAELGRRTQAAAWCDGCETHPAGACESHVDDLDQADAYAELGRQLGQDADR